MRVLKGHVYVDDEMRRVCDEVLGSHQHCLGPQNDGFEAEVADALGIGPATR
jgi:hypothetical protein